jgi:hypothetical protein
MNVNLELLYANCMQIKKELQFLHRNSLIFSRGTRIRTWDPLLPKQVRYRTALRPEFGMSVGKDRLPKTLLLNLPGHCGTYRATS